jgi:hypothetical protein
VDGALVEGEERGLKRPRRTRQKRRKIRKIFGKEEARR